MYLKNILQSLTHVPFGNDGFARWYAFFHHRHPDVFHQLVVAWQHHGFGDDGLFEVTPSMRSRLPLQCNTMNDNAYYTTYFDDTVKQLTVVVSKIVANEDYNAFGIVPLMIAHRALIECLRFLKADSTVRFFPNLCDSLDERITILIRKLNKVYENYLATEMIDDDWMVQ